MTGGRASGVQGFTLIELVITVAIVALLASVALPVSELAVQRTKEQELRRTLRQIREAIDDHKSPKKEKIYFLRRVPRDPFNADPTLSAAATWGKRSYASPPDDPKEGDDVFDVFSLAPGKGINGQPYRDWS